jgi:hypothetical protein
MWENNRNLPHRRGCRPQPPHPSSSRRKDEPEKRQIVILNLDISSKRM